jgi:predicted acetyltransferase
LPAVTDDRAPAIRLLTDEAELVEAARLVGQTMLGSVTDEVARAWGEMFAPDTTHGAVSAAGDVVGIARWFATELSMAGPVLPAAGVTAVAVLPTHRRQGHLTRLMQAELESIVEAEVPIALLVAAEWPIYGRFGYGPAIEACGFEIDTATARFLAPPSGSIELLSPEALRPHLEAVHDARWRSTMGAVTRSATFWDRLSGVEQWPGDKGDPGQRRGALWRDGSGEVAGAVAYRVEDQWTRNRPTGRIHVSLLVGTTPEAERELWRHLCESDWIATVAAGARGVDDPLPLLLDDGRAATQLDRFDCIWARILDVPRVLGARRAPLPGRAVVEVVDDLGYASGRWSLDLDPDGAEVAATSEDPDVRLPVAALGAACLGGTGVAKLHAAGWVDEERPGGVERLDALLRTSPAPWSPTTY